mmetsp:Transcript_55926/g.119101  ORF Transcript_55926/g.119101 Transcript_55926/m.119101 type:complete len:124 (+) Transcript_55926:341-712(+)
MTKLPKAMCEYIMFAGADSSSLSSRERHKSSLPSVSVKISRSRGMKSFAGSGIPKSSNRKNSEGNFDPGADRLGLQSLPAAFSPGLNGQSMGACAITLSNRNGGNVRQGPEVSMTTSQFDETL